MHGLGICFTGHLPELLQLRLFQVRPTPKANSQEL